MKNKFWEDRNGNQSSTRLLVIVTFINALLMGWYNLIVTTDVPSTIALVTAITGVVAGWKIMQNKDEKSL